MNGDKNRGRNSQPQTAANPAGDAKVNPFENNELVNDKLQSAKEELEKEQQFKEAQTERD